MVFLIQVIGDESLMGFGRMKLNHSVDSPMTSAGGAAPSPSVVRRSVAAGRGSRGSPGVNRVLSAGGCQGTQGTT